MFTMLNQQLFMLFKLMVAYLFRVISHANCLLNFKNIEGIEKKENVGGPRVANEL